jgi:hypothetical protein
MKAIVRAAAIGAAAIGVATTVQATGCTRSYEYLATSAPDRPAESRQDGFKTCLATLDLANVREAFVLKDGGIGVVPRREGVAATAITLAQFCRRHPRGVLRFVSRDDLRRAPTIGRLVLLSSTGSTPCSKIVGSVP